MLGLLLGKYALTVSSQAVVCIFNSVLFVDMKWSDLFLFFAFYSSSVLSKIQDEVPIAQSLLPTDSSDIIAKENVEVVTEMTIPITVKPENANPCFHSGDLCYQNPNFTANCCEVHPTIPDSIVCCNVTDIDVALQCHQRNTSTWINVHIFNATIETLNLSKPIWKRLSSLAVTDGKIKKLVDTFQRMTSAMVCLNFSNNDIIDIDKRALVVLTNLTHLDLSFNNLTSMPHASTVDVDIRGSKNISCKKISEKIERNVTFLYKDSSFCLKNNSYTWFNTTDYISITNWEKTEQLATYCSEQLKHCKCNAHLASGQSNEDGIEVSNLIFHAIVDCSNLGLSKLPLKLPENTITLNVSNNRITSLSELSDNDYYKNIVNLYADNNLISSIIELDSSKFLEKFSQLALRKNKIKQIPMYFLNKMIERNHNGGVLYLAENKITCDCLSAKSKRVSYIEL